ncbi:MAG: YhdH/YhfP family quinone oxidoreductase [Verrucomicrobia bacterium]|nr:YhdH/YhfP family quinone oxidoreductase [Verrucomicrobiota bacterium]MCH8511392.1 YhdH/YhfP family quinone oxidoreductase [Kiritimatiellia bacterium]
MSFTALLVTETAPKQFTHALARREISDLPEHDTLIRVQWSSLNYKDALSFSGNKGITRNYPHTPGVDAAGVIEDSPAFEKGAEVIVVGFDLGMNTPGGLAEYIRVPSEWVIPKPQGLSLRECMILGTAGFTAAQCLYRLQQNGLRPESGQVVVTGATGGVGSVAIALLSKAGFNVVASSRNPEQATWLLDVGAIRIVDADELTEDAGKPLLKGRWAGAVETVGGKTLEVLTRSMQHRGIITCCGMITGSELHTNVFPFILRGLSLIGIDSAECPMPMKKEIWHKLSTDWKPDVLDLIALEIPLSDAADALGNMIRGHTRGRTVVRIA